jgi:hypothetical protein
MSPAKKLRQSLKRQLPGWLRRPVEARQMSLAEARYLLWWRTNTPQGESLALPRVLQRAAGRLYLMEQDAANKLPL